MCHNLCTTTIRVHFYMIYSFFSVSKCNIVTEKQKGSGIKGLMDFNFVLIIRCFFLFYSELAKNDIFVLV